MCSKILPGSRQLLWARCTTWGTGCNDWPRWLLLMQNMVGFKLNVAVKWVALWIYIWENLGSDVNLEIIYPERFLCFS